MSDLLKLTDAELLESKDQTYDAAYWKKEAFRYKHRAKRLRKSATTKLRASLNQLTRESIYDLATLFSAASYADKNDMSKLFKDIVAIIYPEI